MAAVRLGTMAFDLDTHELSKAGRTIHLAAQPARLLALLVARAPALVTHAEIRTELWGDTHVEFDAAVHACISQIRTALGDSARSPRFIETVPRRGYRCLLDQRPGAPSDFRTDAPPSVRPEVGSHRGIRGRRTPVTLAAVTLMAVIGGVLWSVGRAAHLPASRSLAAMQKFERGMSGLADAGPAELLSRVSHFETAIGSDPQFAAAYAGLAQAKLLLGMYRVESPQIAYAAAKSAAATSLRLDPRLAQAHAAFGTAVLLFEWDWRLAREHLRRAIVLDPRSVPAQLWWSRYLSAAGEHASAITAARRAVALAPGSPSAITQLGIAHYYAGRLDAARAACAEAVALMREFVPAQACERAAGGAPAGSPNLLLVRPVELVQRGDREGAFEWLQRAANLGSDSLIFAGVEPGFEPLRDDPRFHALLRRVGAPLLESQ